MTNTPPIDQQVRRNIGDTPEPREFGTVHWATKQGDPPGAEMMLGVAIIEPGKGNVEHTHPNAEEIVYVLEGEMRHTLGRQETVLHAGDMIVVPRDVPHRFHNTSDAPLRALIVFSSPDRAFVPTDAR